MRAVPGLRQIRRFKVSRITLGSLRAGTPAIATPSLPQKLPGRPIRVDSIAEPAPVAIAALGHPSSPAPRLVRNREIVPALGLWPVHDGRGVTHIQEVKDVL